MTNFNNFTLLEIVEEFASINGMMYPDEESVSVAFDESIAPLVVEQYGEDDLVAISESFSDWVDELCTDGELHAEQYNNYEYVGKYS